ncbi:MAG: hypothetical protein ABIP89_03595, partial [Polyangiaceae bacterium]
DDYACLAEGYLALFEAGENVVWLDRAIQLVDEARARFAAPKGGFYAGDVPAPFERMVALEDGAEPSGNAVLIRVLSRLAHVGTRAVEWNALATQALAHYAGTIREHGIDMGGWLDAALLDAGPFYEVVIAGPSSTAMDRVLREVSAPWTTSIHVPAGGANAPLVERLPGVAGKTSASDVPRAFVCERGACKAPTTDANALRRQITAGWMH